MISKRFCTKQQMQWTPRGAHLLWQIRTRVFNGEWEATFRGGIRDSVPLPNSWRRDPQASKALGVEHVSFATRSRENVPRSVRQSRYNGQHIDCRVCIGLWARLQP
jgi:hypothetical protein